MSGRLRRPSPALVISVVALFVALGGSSYAALKISSKNVVNNSLTSSDIKNRSLLKKDFKSGQLPRGARGLQGPQGVPGAAGRAGRDGFGALTYSIGQTPILAAESPTGDTYADCPIGQHPTGGDAYYATEDDATPVYVMPVRDQGLSYDDAGNPVGWFATAGGTNTTGEVVDFIVEAVCANANSVDFVQTPQASRPLKKGTRHSRAHAQR